MRFLLATAIVASLAVPALLAVPAFAQQTHVPKYGEADPEKTTSEKAADKAAADAYQRSLGAIPDKGTTDPWGTVRSDAPKATATKAAKTKTKTGSADVKPQ